MSAYSQFHVSYGGAVTEGVYLTVQRRSDGLWFRPATGTWAARTPGDSPVPYRLPLTATGGDSYILTVPPAVDLPSTPADDAYLISYYLQLTDPATDSDTLLLSEEERYWETPEEAEEAEPVGYAAFAVSYQSGTAPNGIYLTWMRAADAQFFRTTDGVFETFNAANLALYKQSLTDRGGDDWAVTVEPTAPLPSGTYRVRYYLQATGAPLVTDEQIDWEDVVWTGAEVETAGATGIAAGRYINQTYLNRIAGTVNLTTVTDRDGDGNEDPGAVQVGIDATEDETDGELMGNSRYAVPFVFTGSGDNAFKYYLAIRTLEKLYGERVRSGVENPKFADALKRADAYFMAIQNGSQAVLNAEALPAANVVISVPSVARADGTAVDDSDLAGQLVRERLVNAEGGWYGWR